MYFSCYGSKQQQRIHSEEVEVVAGKMQSNLFLTVSALGLASATEYHQVTTTWADNSGECTNSDAFINLAHATNDRDGQGGGKIYTDSGFCKDDAGADIKTCITSSSQYKSAYNIATSLCDKLSYCAGANVRQSTSSSSSYEIELFEYHF